MSRTTGHRLAAGGGYYVAVRYKNCLREGWDAILLGSQYGGPHPSPESAVCDFVKRHSTDGVEIEVVDARRLRGWTPTKTRLIDFLLSHPA